MKAFKLFPIFVAALLAAAVFSGCPLSAPNTPVDPAPARFQDRTDIYVSVGWNLLDQPYVLDQLPFVTTLVQGAVAKDTVYWVNPEAVDQYGNQATTDVRRYKITYRAMGGTRQNPTRGEVYTFECVVENDPQTGIPSIRDAITGNPVTGAAAALVSAWVIRESFQTLTCAGFNLANITWTGLPILCVNGPFLKENIDAGAPDTVLEFDPELCTKSSLPESTMKSNQRFDPWVELLIDTSTLISVSYEVEYEAWGNGTAREWKRVAGSLEMDFDGDGKTNGWEIDHGTDPFDPNDPNPHATLAVVIAEPSANQSFQVGDTANFRPLVTGGTPPYSYIWQVPDETGGMAVVRQATFTKTWTKPGAGQIWLWVTDAKGITATDVVQVAVVGTKDNGPSVHIEYPGIGDDYPSGSQVTFVASGSGGTPSWTFSGPGAGNGAGSATGYIVNRFFDGLGTVNALATITNVYGSANDSTIIDIVQGSAPSVSITAPQNGAMIETGTPTTFVATATAGATVVWNFPDNTSLTGTSVVKTFSVPVSGGNVTATAINSGGSTTASITVTVSNPIPSSLSATVTSPINVTVGQSPVPALSVVVGQPNTYTVAVTGGVQPYSYRWHFGDSDFKYLQSVIKVFDMSGSADSYVTVTDAIGAQVMLTFHVTSTPN